MTYNIQPDTIDQGDPCPKCGNNYRYVDTGKCVSCTKRSLSNNTNMILVNKRRQLQKEKELRGLDKDYYFED